MNTNSILLEFPNEYPPEDLLRIQRNVHAMIEQGAFSVRNGRVILHFDNQGELQIIAMDFIKWKKQKGVSDENR